MFAEPNALPDLDQLDPSAVKALCVDQHATIEHLLLVIARYERMHFGRRSEKINTPSSQMDLGIFPSPVDDSQQATPAPTQSSPAPRRATPKRRRPLPAHLRREVHTHLPSCTACPECGGTLKKLGEDVSEMLEYVPASYYVICHVRPKLSCARCSLVVQAPAPSRPVDRGMAGPGMLAHVLTGKYSDHLPLYRQSQIYARHGLDLDRSTLARWVSETGRLLEPLVEALHCYVMDTDNLHGDDTPLPVLAPGNGRTKTGRFWTYVRDARPAGDHAPPAVWFTYSPDRKGEHPQRHLANFCGILQADAFWLREAL